MTEPRGPYRWLSPDFLTDLFRDPLDPGYADAAARRRQREAAGEPDRWRRGARGATLVTLVLVGLLFAVAYRHVVAEEPTRTQVRSDLEEQIRERSAAAEELQKQAEDLRDEVAGLRERELADHPQARQLRELEAATGLTKVRGDGVVIEVGDGPSEVDPVTGVPVIDPEARILDVDLQRIVNGLWAAGAEAIAVNDRRLTANSTIRAASAAILVDRVPVVSPYRVAAIGPGDLADRFDDSATAQVMRQLAEEYGITYEVREVDDLTLPAATAPQLHHATPGGDS